MTGGISGGAILTSDLSGSAEVEKIPRFAEAPVIGSTIGPGGNGRSRRKRAGRRRIQH